MEEISVGPLIHEIKDYEVRISQEKNEKFDRHLLDFADKLDAKNQSSEFYARKRNTDPVTARLNILLGKKAELMAMLALKVYFGFPITDLDLEIREKGKKGWLADLIYPDLKVHVKGCNKDTKRMIGDYSWTFQDDEKTGSGRDDVFVNGDDDLAVLVYCEEWYSEHAVIKAVVPFRWLRTKFREPKFDKHKGKKNCIYYGDLL